MYSYNLQCWCSSALLRYVVKSVWKFVPSPSIDFLREFSYIIRNALCKDVLRGCSHHTNQARIYLKSDTKSPRGLYFNPA